MRKSPQEQLHLVGRTFTVTRPGEPERKRDLPDEELARVLRGDIGLPLSDAEMDAILAALG